MSMLICPHVSAGNIDAIYRVLMKVMERDIAIPPILNATSETIIIRKN